MATVFLARDRELRREVAVKVLYPHLARRAELVARFQREGRAAAALDHRHIVRVLDVGGAEPGQGGDPPYLVLELVRGPSLAEVPGPLLAEVVAAAGVALCGALAVAHRAGVVHRDVKPGNVLVADGGRLVLGDFGVARVDEDSVVTRTGAVLGTPAFMAPEQATGDPVSARSDLYSLGATLYALGTGTLPYAGNAARVVSQIVRGERVPAARRNPAMGAELAAIIDRLMAVDPADRFADAESAAEALLAVCRAGGFDDPDALLAEAFAGDADRDALTARVVAATLGRAREAIEGRRLPRAMSLCDRVLALDADNREALTLVDSLGARSRRARWLGGAAAVAVALAGYAMWPTAGAARLAVADGADAGLAGLTAGSAESSGAAITPAGEIAVAPGADGEADAGAIASLEPTAAAEGRRPGNREGAGFDEDADGPSARRGPERGDTELAGKTTAGTAAAAKRPAAGDRPAAATDRSATGDPATDRSATGDPATDRSATADRSATDRSATADPATDRSATGDSATDPAAPEPALVTFAIRPWCDLSVDGTPRGRADPTRPLRLAPGRHDIVCAQPGTGASFRDTITVVAGERRTVRGTVLADLAVTVAVTGGDAVRIAGHGTVRRGQVLRLDPARLRVEVLARGDVVDRAYISFRGDCQLRDRPRLGCYAKP